MCFQTDKFDLVVGDLGELDRLLVGHDGSSVGSGWFLDRVEVSVDDSLLGTFDCGRWLDVGEDDKMVERILPLSSQPKDTSNSKSRVN